MANHLRIVRPILPMKWRPIKPVSEDCIDAISALSALGWDTLRIVRACAEVVDYSKQLSGEKIDDSPQDSSR